MAFLGSILVGIPVAPGWMSSLPLFAIIAIAVILATDRTLAQATANPPVPETEDTPPPISKETDGMTWSFSNFAYTYFVPDGGDIVQPTVTADRGRVNGFLAGLSCKRVEITAYVFNPDESRPTVVLGVGLGF